MKTLHLTDQDISVVCRALRTQALMYGDRAEACAPGSSERRAFEIRINQTLNALDVVSGSAVHLADVRRQVA